MNQLQTKLERKMREFHHTFFERGAENRFNDLIEQGQAAYPELLEALRDEETGERIDALVALGRLFDSHGHTDVALVAVVAHAKTIHEGGMGPERQAALFAIGRSREASLIESFVPLLGQPDPAAVNIALFVLGYARWQDATPFIRFLIHESHRDTVQAAIWALGQIGRDDATDLLLPMLRRGENLEWVTGALGDLGMAEALEDLIGLLDNPRPDLRFLSIAAVWAIIDQNKDHKVRREWEWMHASLRSATHDAFPPVAVFGALILAELGQKLEPDILQRLFNIDATGADLESREAFYLSKQLN